MNRLHSTTDSVDADRVLRAYADRSARGLGRRYKAHRPEMILAAHQVERVLLTELGARGWTDFRRLEVLDVGCGSGGPLVRLISHGVDPTSAHGVDLRESAIDAARSRLPSADLRVGNAAELSYADGTMDLVLQFTMFSSILDAAVRAKVAGEMSRVVRPGGLIVSYDFRINPLNPDTRGLGRRGLRALFPGHRIEARTVTLAPPIARLVAPRSYGIAAALQALVPLRTHLLAFIHSAGAAGSAAAAMITHGAAGAVLSGRRAQAVEVMVVELEQVLDRDCAELRHECHRSRGARRAPA